MTEFDPIKALREEISGLADVRTTIRNLQVSAEGKMGRAEAEYNAVTKLVGFADAELARKREVLRGLEEEAKR